MEVVRGILLRNVIFVALSRCKVAVTSKIFFWPDLLHIATPVS